MCNTFPLFFLSFDRDYYNKLLLCSCLWLAVAENERVFLTRGVSLPLFFFFHHVRWEHGYYCRVAGSNPWSRRKVKVPPPEAPYPSLLGGLAFGPRSAGGTPSLTEKKKTAATIVRGASNADSGVSEVYCCTLVYTTWYHTLQQYYFREKSTVHGTVDGPI